jgi:hypothetical protein
MVYKIGPRFRQEFDEQIDIAIGTHSSTRSRPKHRKFLDRISAANIFKLGFLDRKVAHENREAHIPLDQLVRKRSVVGHSLNLGQAGAGSDLDLFAAGGIEGAIAPYELDIGKADSPAAARSASAQGVIFQ